MSKLAQFYQKQANAMLSTTSWLAGMQKKALQDFDVLGFPTRKDEEWKYTRLDSFFNESFSLGQDTQASPLKVDQPTVLRVEIVNGQVSVPQTTQSQLPEGVVVQSLRDAVEHHSDVVESHLGQSFVHTHGFHALNTAMMQCGVVVIVPKGVQIEQPLLLAHQQTKENQALYIRHLIIVEEGGRVSLLEDYQGIEGRAYFTCGVTEIHAKKNAHVTHYKVQREGKKAYHISELTSDIAESGRVDSYSLSIGGSLVRSDTTMHLNQENATCLMYGIYAPKDGQHIDHHTLVEHKVPDCHSDQDYRGILSGRSRAVFNGKVKVAPNAQHTVAKQQNKNLLLSANAEIDTKPQLEIFANDVICTHGATVGQLDEDALFYLATRGIEREDASQFLVHAFAADNLSAIDESKIAEWMDALLTQHLGSRYE